MSDNVLQFVKKPELPEIVYTPTSETEEAQYELLKEYAHRRARMLERQLCTYIDALARVEDTETAMHYIEKFMREAVDEDLEKIRRAVRDGLKIDVVFREMMLAKMSADAPETLSNLRKDEGHVDFIKGLLADEAASS